MQALAHAATIDKIIKGIGRGNLWEELLRLGLTLCESRPGPRSG